MSLGKIFLVVNPCSGRAKMKNHLLSIVQIFSAAGYEVTVYPTKSVGDAARTVASLKNGEFDVVICCGGDGTLNETITGMISSDLNFKVGYIPSGTLNEWSGSLGIAKNVTRAANDILKMNTLALDIGKFSDDKFFCYTASFGAFTEPSYTTRQDLKNIWGQAAYIFEGIKSVTNIKPIPLTVTTEDKKISGEFLFGAISNSLSLGGVLKLDETIVDLSDGLFEVVLIRNPKSISEFQTIVDAIIKKDLTRPGIEFFHAKNICVQSEGILNWTLDGEHAKSDTQVQITNIQKKINFIVPKN